MKGATCALGGGHPPAVMLALRGRTVAATQFLWELRLVTCGKVMAQGRFQAAFKESTHCSSLVWEWLEKEGAMFSFSSSLLALLQVSMSYCYIIQCLMSHPKTHYITDL